MITPLSQVPFAELMRCFNTSFAGYFVPMPTDPGFWWTRWKAARVDYDLSFGWLEEGELVGFMVHAVDQRQGKLTAFNTGTGVLPAFRGKGITKQMYREAVPILKKAGVERCALEVIVDNKAAIHTYQQVGLEIYKTLHCFKGSVPAGSVSPPTLKDLSPEMYSSLVADQQAQYAWDNHLRTLDCGVTQYKGIEHEGSLESCFALKPETSHLAQFEVLNDSPLAWTRLAAALQHSYSTLKVNNVDATQTTKLAWLQGLGMENVVDQYEMEMDL